MAEEEGQKIMVNIAETNRFYENKIYEGAERILGYQLMENGDKLTEL